TCRQRPCRKPQRKNANRQPDLRATIEGCGRNLVNLDVNKSPKILTAAFLILLALSLLFSPWGDEYGRSFPRLSPLDCASRLGPLSGRMDNSPLLPGLDHGNYCLGMARHCVRRPY